MIKSLCLFVGLIGVTSFSNSAVFAQEYKMLGIQNCQQEMRTGTFQGQVRFFWKCAYGMSNIKNQKILQFLPSYRLDTSFLQKQIEKIRKLVPPGFFNPQLTGNSYDNVPDESAIWFTEIFAKKDKQGNIIAYAAYRITFEGDNAHQDEQRISPRISNIEFIFDKASLTKLAKQLKTLPESGG